MKKIHLTGIFLLYSLFSFAQWTDDVSKNVQVAGVNAADIQAIGVSGGKTWIAYYSQRGSNYDMRAQLLDSTGRKLLGDNGLLVSDKPSGSATFVFNVCINGQGDLLIGYQYEIDGVLNAVLSRVTQQGILSWGDGVVLGPGLSPYPTVLTSGETAVAWSNADLNTTSVKVIASDGTASSSQANVYVGNTTTTRGQVIANTNGTFTLVFQKNVFVISTALYAQRYNRNLQALWTSPVQLSNQTTSAARYYSLSAESDTTYVGYYSSEGSRFNAFLQRINPDANNPLPYGINGAHFSTDTAITDNYQQTITISQKDSASTVWAICTYSDPNQVNYGVYAQRFIKTTGERLFSDKAKRVLPVSSAMNMQEGELQLTGNDKAGFIFSDNQNHIYSTKLDNKGNIDSTVGTVLMASTGNQKSRIHFAGNDVIAVAVWSENRGSDDFPYAQNVTPDGVTGVLPVVISSFTAVKKEKAVVLSWTTLNETNNKRFYIERSSDGRTYSALDFIAAKNNTAGNVYSFNDNQPLPKHNYYRLQIVDNNGRITYSETVEVTMEASGSISITKVFPNPAQNTVYAEMESTKDSKINTVLTNASGKTISQKSMMVSKGLNRLPFNVDSLSYGSYFITITNDDGTKTKLKFTKL